MEKVGRNAPCPCGSGKKFKRCHAGKSVEATSGPAATVNAATQADELFEIGRGLAESLLKKVHAGTYRTDDLLYQRAMLSFFAKAYKTYQGAELLWNRGHTEDAHLLARSIYDIRLQAQFISRDPTKRSKDLMAHLLKIAVGWLELARRLHPDWDLLSLDATVAHLRDLAKTDYYRVELKDDPRAAEGAIKKKWWEAGGIKNGIRGLAEALALEGGEHDWVGEYEWVYAYLSRYEHSDAWILTEYVRLSEEQPTALEIYPDNTETHFLNVPLSITGWLFEIASLTGRAFHLDFDETVDDAVKRARGLLN
jgi:hypothetical protein